MNKTGLILAIMAEIIMTGCAVNRLSDAEKIKQKTAEQMAVNQALIDRHYRVDVETMMPRRGGARPVSYGFYLEVRGDTIISYLPYFGRAYSIPYGGGKGLIFTQKIIEYQEVQNAKKKHVILVKTHNEEDDYQMMLDVYENGDATIRMQARERESISYEGKIEGLKNQR